MTPDASGGTADRIAARTLFNVLRAGSGTPARYSSTFFGAALPFAAELRSPEFPFFMGVICTRLPCSLECHPERGPAQERIKPAFGLMRWLARVQGPAVSWGRLCSREQPQILLLTGGARNCTCTFVILTSPSEAVHWPSEA